MTVASAILSNPKSQNSLNKNFASNWLADLSFLWLELTNKCNLECVHCYANSSPHEPLIGSITTEKWRNVLDDAYSLGCRAVQFIGGEPTLHPDFQELVLHAHNNGFQYIEVYTNATRLTPDICKLLSERNVRVAASVYGPVGEIHDTVTTRNGSFDRTIAGLTNALQSGIDVRVGVISMQENETAIAETQSLLQKLGIESIRIDRSRNVGRARSCKAKEKDMRQLCGACWQGKLAINSNGDVSPCVFSHEWNIGHVSEGLRSLLQKSELQNFRTECHNLSAEQQSQDTTDCPPCFPSRCDPDICNPDNCSPLD